MDFLERHVVRYRELHSTEADSLTRRICLIKDTDDVRRQDWVSFYKKWSEESKLPIEDFLLQEYEADKRAVEERAHADVRAAGERADTAERLLAARDAELKETSVRCSRLEEEVKFFKQNAIERQEDALVNEEREADACAAKDHADMNLRAAEERADTAERLLYAERYELEQAFVRKAAARDAELKETSQRCFELDEELKLFKQRAIERQDEVNEKDAHVRSLKSKLSTQTDLNKQLTRAQDDLAQLQSLLARERRQREAAHEEETGRVADLEYEADELREEAGELREEL